MIKVTCDKCGKEIECEFVYIRSDFYTKADNSEDDLVGFCANGDELVFCDACYSKYVQCEDDL